MNFETSLIHPAVQALGWALLHFAWQGAALAALFLVADTLTRRSQARLRYAIGCLVMLLMLAVFAATIVRGHPVQTPAVAASPGVVGSQFEGTRTVAQSTVGTVLQGSRTVILERLTVLPALAVCLWLAGIAVLTMFTAGGWIRVQRLRRRGAGPVNAAWTEALEDLMRRMQVSRPVRLYTSTIAEVPTLIGWVRPYILLPVSAITGLGESQLRAILAHELAHVRRYDYLINLLQTAVETMFFYHPAVWWVSRRVREEREYCCDDLAVAVCTDVMVYAGALAQLEELRGSFSEPSLAATGGDLLTRIRRLVGQGSEKGRDRIPGPVGVTMAVALVLCTITGASIVPAMRAQSTLQFEVATIKPTDPNVPHMVGVKIRPGGRLVITAVPLKTLVSTAFRLSHWQISGAAEWMEKVDYDLEAQPPEDLRSLIKDRRYTWYGIEDERLREMLQALLIERFQLKFHRETKTGDVYHLVRNGKTLRLRPTEIPSPEAERDLDRFASIGYAGARWVLSAYSMSQLAKFASDYVVHVPVSDRTELSGLFDYKQTVLDAEPNYSDNSASFLRLIQEVGLKLERAKGPVETFVIDHAAKPSPN
jgi:uncharacterized protein (TIGR03435 family)